MKKIQLQYKKNSMKNMCLGGLTESSESCVPERGLTESSESWLTNPLVNKSSG